jgi:hypothetical protein
MRPDSSRMLGVLCCFKLIFGSALEIGEIVVAAVHGPLWPVRQNPAITEVGR